MPEIVLFATIWRAPGWHTEAILEPKKAPAAQPALDRTSVFPRENWGFGRFSKQLGREDGVI